MDSKVKEVFRKMREDEENSCCFDCGNIDITHCSVRLSIFLCTGCAYAHRTLIPEIGEVKRMSDLYSPKELNVIQAGGNGSLKSFFAMYSIPCNDSIEYKYRTKACKYYKEMLEMMATGTACTMLTPSEAEGVELADEYNRSPTCLTEGNAETPSLLTVESPKDSGITKAISSFGSFTSSTFSAVSLAIQAKTDLGISYFRTKLRRHSARPGDMKD